MTAVAPSSDANSGCPLRHAAEPLLATTRVLGGTNPIHAASSRPALKAEGSTIIAAIAGNWSNLWDRDQAAYRVEAVLAHDHTVDRFDASFSSQIRNQALQWFPRQRRSASEPACSAPIKSTTRRCAPAGRRCQILRKAYEAR